ncbi:hypothetical protein F2Q70_00027893 [Brassica cretica]|uniref:Uncharacterized protein n=1 Tax=Brassica cretica TaxID=69181 RepID=A0A8S9LGC7_BRACR|nr:hypothetical protein F2Q70_00027893 [Brassica cretica]
MHDRWVLDIYITIQWVWMGLDGQLGKCSTYGDIKLPTARVCLAFRSGNTTLADGEYAPAFNMSELWDGLQRSDRDD